MSTPEHTRGWNDALKLAHEQIQKFALHSGLDTESSAYQCDLIVGSLYVNDEKVQMDEELIHGHV